MTTVGADVNVDLDGDTRGLPDTIRSLVPALEDDRYLADELQLSPTSQNAAP
ncbi:hypothetical protein [Micromonospora sp. CB01531]|uniref:hypothetical protein n=1 Tax=Micromonospora sp. CB01531 TaxID=1718947 RepID=UPI000A551453|nr:hypothetical protein [Micromonospora sp. CB01531]